jgi:hypothetical protein
MIGVIVTDPFSDPFAGLGHGAAVWVVELAGESGSVRRGSEPSGYWWRFYA